VPELVRRAAATARRHRWPLSIHVAESAQEFDMFRHRRGELHDWLRRNERDMADCGLGSPVQQLERCRALGRNLLAVHVNYLGSDDASLLATRKVSVAHCPRSHAYFQHRPFPFGNLTRAGANVCLGTDSLATVYKRHRDSVELNLFEEMRAFAHANPRLTAKRILPLVTVNAARALGLAGRVGEIAPGAFADLIAIPFAGRAGGVYEAVLHHRGDVAASLIDGRWAVAPEG
jgi:cytosine/adenosine deaminase-related metal-dependent hydrolase